MRLDKFLKVSRIIKRRTIAKEIADASRITVNNRVAKAGTLLSIDDVVEIRYSNKLFVFRVLKLMDSTKKDDAKSMFEIIEEKNLPIPNTEVTL